jgi:hypothetical protein
LNKISPISNRTTLTQPCLYISCLRKSSMISTTINSRDLYFYEMCVRQSFQMNENGSSVFCGQDNASNLQNLIPLSFMMTTNPRSLSCLNQWLTLFFNTEKNLFHNYHTRVKEKDFNSYKGIKYIICDSSISLIETTLGILNKQTLVSYANDCFSRSVHRTESQPDFASTNELDLDLRDLNASLLRSIGVVDVQKTANLKYVIHACTNQVMKEIGSLCKFYYSYGISVTKSFFCFFVVNKEFNYLFEILKETISTLECMHLALLQTANL